MPNIITHAFLAQDTIEAIETPTLSNLIAQYPQVYSMGSSGPDFLFYYKILPWEKADPAIKVKEIGNLIHSGRINDFYQSALGVIQTTQDDTTRNIMTVFLAGHLTHWALDSVAHPYVFAKTGVIGSGVTKYWHFRFESMLDTLMVTQVKGFKIENIKMPEFVASTKETRKAVAFLYRQIVLDLFEEDIPEAIYEECLVSMASTAKLLYDPYTLKFPGIQAGEKLAGKLWEFSGHMVIGDPDTKHDILNLNHALWTHPCDETLISTESFLDLFLRAKDRAMAALYALEGIITMTQPKAALNLITRDLSYDTGLPKLTAMTHYDPIY
jgi:hypothetical protein